MAEEFEAGICGESWWNNISSTRSLFPINMNMMMMGSSSTCSLDAPNYINNNNNNNFLSNANFLDAGHNNPSESGTNLLIDSTLASSSIWNPHHSLLIRGNRGRAENNFHSGGDANNLKAIMNNQLQEFSGGFPIGSSYGSTLMQSTLYNEPQNTVFTNQSATTTQLSPTWSTTTVSNSASSLNGLQFANNTPFWNASAEALHDIRSPPLFSSSSSSSPSQTHYIQTPPAFEDKPLNAPTTLLLNKLKREESPDKASAVNKSGNSEQPAFKRPRIETPSPLPTFKVRKEKLGDRITALQQLVSPFGKTDTASVLHEAIEYIKFLHDQVNVLSTPPYMKNGAPVQHEQGCDDGNVKGSEDLRRRGLCLVPISSTFPMATETTADFWTPTFGGLISR